MPCLRVHLGWGWGCCYISAVSRHLIPIGIHTLDIGIVISALGFSAIDPA